MLFSACGGDDVVDEQEHKPTITPTPEPEVVKDHVSDLTGVWQSTTDDGVYFLAISDKGEVTYCLNRITLGKGTAKFLKDTLKISNDFTDETDIMFVTNRVGDTIDISGKIKAFKTDSVTDISQKLVLTKERYVYSYKKEQAWENEDTIRIYTGVDEDGFFIGIGGYFCGKSTYSFISDDRFRQDLINCDTRQLVDWHTGVYVGRNRVLKDSTISPTLYFHLDALSKPYIYRLHKILKLDNGSWFELNLDPEKDMSENDAISRVADYLFTEDYWKYRVDRYSAHTYKKSYGWDIEKILYIMRNNMLAKQAKIINYKE